MHGFVFLMLFRRMLNDDASEKIFYKNMSLYLSLGLLLKFYNWKGNIKNNQYMYVQMWRIKHSYSDDRDTKQINVKCQDLSLIIKLFG